MNPTRRRNLVWNVYVGMLFKFVYSNFYTLCFAIQTYALVHVKMSSTTLLFHEINHQHLFQSRSSRKSFWSICVALCCKSTLVIRRNLPHSLIHESKTSNLPFTLKVIHVPFKRFSLKNISLWQNGARQIHNPCILLLVQRSAADQNVKYFAQ